MTPLCDSRHRGYTLIELLAVLAILGLLLTMAWPFASLTIERERERDLKRALWSVRDAIDAYKRLADAGAIEADPSGYPPNLQILVDGVVDRRSGRRAFLLRSVPADPFAPAGQAAVDTWSLRSYQPAPAGAAFATTVYDLHSRSTAVALDGTPISNW